MKTKDIHILFLSSWYPSEEIPFNGNFVFKHAESVSRFCRVTFLNVSKEKIMKKDHLLSDHSENLIFKEFSTSNFLTQLPLKILPSIEKYLLFFKECRRLRKSIDVIHANITFPIGLMAYVMFKLYKIPYIITEHWTAYLPYSPARISFYKRKLIQLILKNAKTVCPVSEDLRDAMLNIGLQGNYRVIPNVVNEKHITQRVEKTRQQKIKMAHISSLNEDQKNITGILRVIKRLSSSYSNFELHIISDCSAGDAQQTCDSLEIPKEQIFFHGPFTPIQITDFLSTCDLFILFSNYENLPCVIIEALACGVPILSTDVGGIRELINQENGILIRKEQENQLFDAIEKFIRDEIHYNPLLIQQAALEKFSYNTVGRSYIEEYTKAIQHD